MAAGSWVIYTTVRNWEEGPEIPISQNKFNQRDKEICPNEPDTVGFEPPTLKEPGEGLYTNCIVPTA